MNLLNCGFFKTLFLDVSQLNILKSWTLHLKGLYSNQEKQSNKVNSNGKYAMLHLRFTSCCLLKINYQLINYCSRQRIEEKGFQCKQGTKIPTWCRPKEDTAFQQYSIFLPATITAKFCSWVMISYSRTERQNPPKILLTSKFSGCYGDLMIYFIITDYQFYVNLIC